MAGSALLKDETRVSQILEAVVNAVEVPVTLKIQSSLLLTRCFNFAQCFIRA
jgi:dihydroorotate dehydrogenase